jgi:hypothetical protein
VLTWGLHREFVRLEREARLRRMMALPEMVKLRRDLERLQVEIGRALLPSLQQMGQALNDAFAAMQKAPKEDA